MSGETLIVGANGENSGAQGVNGNQDDNSAQEAGAAYAFDLGIAPGAPFCLGDPGSGSPCPCGNDNDGNAPASGCANGASASGAQLTGSGTASASADTMILRTTGLDPRDFGLYFQADDALNGGDGVPFGDGLRCAGGNLIQLEIRLSNAAGVSWTTIAIGAAGGVAPGDTRRYQCWYRDNSGAQPCGVGVNDFNLSNGYEVTWRP